ncbi:hypothetical protein WG906_09615 [Pedobacter sp. P351]|uniref:hypothetical protein n=1 Tax=Pedobacter superstes TaxID=3133441 RepID=UPI00309D4FA6
MKALAIFFLGKIRLLHIVLAFLLIFSLGCKKEKSGSISTEESEIINFSFNNGSFTAINKQKREIVVEIADYIPRDRLTAVFQLSKGATARVNDIEQKSSATQNNFINPVIYTVIAANGLNANWTVKVTSNHKRIGLGNNLEADNRITRNYEWYFGKENSGKYSHINGGAACLAMAMKFSHRTEFVSLDVQSLRDSENPEYFSMGVSNANPFSTKNITNSLSKFAVGWKLVSLSSSHAEIIDCIDKGYLVMLELNMSRVRYNPTPLEHTHRYYLLNTPLSTQFIVVKGYKKVDGNLYFECYDPKASNDLYSDNLEIKGRNRYYIGTDIWDAVMSYGGWRYAIVVGNKYIPMSQVMNEVDPLKVPEGLGD